MSPVGWNSLDKTPVFGFPSMIRSLYPLSTVSSTFLLHGSILFPISSFLPEKHSTGPFTGLFTCLKHSYYTVPFYLPSRVFLPESTPQDLLQASLPV
ncbi:hypothetical protein TNCT_454301 [Trichonephila clavata]|uniref:Uncharacterized protein n=1 Tax=Trichonephila clavata TaxID=2740835 RepID=A0A8X6HWQ6_TRICU|nr:hypothetical protein TNCT_454301 [Trichonephila clavata]